jgi:anti-sigma factor ChrR (cupin superfamily)
MYFEGDELAVDTLVYSDAELTIAYADGEYTLADGRAVTVAAGIVTVLTDAAAEDAVTPPATNEASDLATENAQLKQQLADMQAANKLTERKLTAAQNKLAKVPGSTGNPTPPGAVQNMLAKPGAPKNTGGLMVSLTPPNA